MFLEDQIWFICQDRLRELVSIRQQLEDIGRDPRLSFLLDDVRRMEEEARIGLNGLRARALMGEPR